MNVVILELTKVDLARTFFFETSECLVIWNATVDAAAVLITGY